MGKKQDRDLDAIEESLDRIACSLASMSGVLDNIFVEVMNEKEELEAPEENTEFLEKEESNL